MRWTEEEYQELLRKKGVNTKAKPKPAKKSKYRNVKTTIDGITFDSKKEAEYYCQLKLLKQAGEIKDFELQPRFELQPKFKKNGITYRSINYIADFAVENLDGTKEIIDVKSSKAFKTQTYKNKKKMFEYMYPNLTIKEAY